MSAGYLLYTGLQTVKNSHNRSGQFWVLFRHFFSRLSYSDLLKFEDQQRESRVVMLVILAVAGLAVAAFVFEPFLLFGLSSLTAANLWRYESLSLTFTMAVAGLIAVANWDKLILDPIDRIHLLPLPIGIRTLYWGKFTSLLAFAVAVAAIANLFSTLIAAAFPAEILKGLFIGGWAHFAANLLCCIFVFLFVALARIMALIIFPTSIGKPLAVLAQILLLLVVLSPLVWFFMIHHSLAIQKAQGSSLFTYYPPLWFSGVYNRLLGVPDALLDHAARLGLVAIAVLLAAYIMASPFCMRRILGGEGPAQPRNSRQPRIKAGMKAFSVANLFHPIQAAVFQYFWQTVTRSREHKLRLTLFLALPVSFLLGMLAHFAMLNDLTARTRDGLLVSMPLLLHLFLIIGMRMTAAYPHTLPANFIFRISEGESLRYYVSGARLAFIASVVLPPLLPCLLLCLLFWEPEAAIFHALYCLAIALLLLEVCLIRYRAVPFAAEHQPGKYKLRYYWLAFLIGSYLYHETFCALGRRLRSNPGGYPVFFLIVILLYALLRLRRAREMNEERLVFQEEPEPALMTLGLD